VATEIERKFLVINNDWKINAPYSIFRQAYLNSTPERTVRIRIDGEQAFITIKSKNSGIERQEFEYHIPLADAEQLLLLCEAAPLEKKRYRVQYDNHVWEIDEFLGVNAGLIVAEIELQDVAEEFNKPAWLGKEVSDDYRYYNSYLANHPYSTW
jgi:adenylate cyclase